jgi:hypothetical protein
MSLPRLLQPAGSRCRGWVEAHRPELIEKLMEEEHWRHQNHSERALKHPRIPNRGEGGDPDSVIGRMDLIKEFPAEAEAPPACRRSCRRLSRWHQRQTPILVTCGFGGNAISKRAGSVAKIAVE